MTEYTNTPDRNRNQLPNTAETMIAIQKSLEMTNQLILQSNQEISEVKRETRNHRQRLNKLENTAPITRRQADNIKARVKDLARDLVGYPSDIYGVCIQDIYRYLRTYHNLANAVGDTEKQYLNEVIKGLEHYKDNCFDQQRLINHKKLLDESKN